MSTAFGIFPLIPWFPSVVQVEAQRTLSKSVGGR